MLGHRFRRYTLITTFKTIIHIYNNFHLNSAKMEITISLHLFRSFINIIVSAYKTLPQPDKTYPHKNEATLETTETQRYGNRQYYLRGQIILCVSVPPWLTIPLPSSQPSLWPPSWNAGRQYLYRLYHTQYRGRVTCGQTGFPR